MTTWRSLARHDLRRQDLSLRARDSADAFYATFLTPDEKKSLDAWKADAKALRDLAEKDGIKNASVAALESQTFKRGLNRAK